MIWGSWDMQRAGMPTGGGGTVASNFLVFLARIYKALKYLTSSKFLAPVPIIFYLDRVNFRNGNSLLPASYTVQFPSRRRRQQLCFGALAFLPTFSERGKRHNVEPHSVKSSLRLGWFKNSSDFS
jgi:hypothetical protein